MKMKMKLILSAALVAGVFSTQAATQNAAPRTNASPEAAMTALFGDPVVVKGKGFEIKRSELDQVLTSARANAAAQNRQLPPEYEVMVLNQLLTIQVLLQTATPADQAAGKFEADEQYTNLLQKFSSPDAFDRQLKAVGMTIADLRAKATQEAVAKAALKRALNVNVLEADAKDYYNQHAANFEQPELVHARHILLMTIDPTTRAPLTTNTTVAKHKQILELRKRILAGEDFATLATQYSEDPGSKENGGELPEFPRGQMVAEFDSAAFALGTNQVSEVVTTQYGYHLIKVLEKLPAKKFGFNEMIPQLNETAAAYCTQKLESDKISLRAPEYVKKLRGDEQVEILDPALKAADAQFQASQAAQAATDAPAPGAGK